MGRDTGEAASFLCFLWFFPLCVEACALPQLSLCPAHAAPGLAQSFQVATKKRKTTFSKQAKL